MDHTEARDMADAYGLHIAMGAIVTALDALRAGRLRLDNTRDPGTLSTISTALHQATCRLAPRLQGALDALIRAHYDAGGSHGELARAMEVERSTAQYQGDRVRKTIPPTHWELWAAGELDPQTRPAAEVRPGWTLVVDDQHMQVSRVVHHVDSGHVSITTVGGTISHTAEAGLLVIPRDVATRTVTGEERMPDGAGAAVEIHERA